MRIFTASSVCPVELSASGRKAERATNSEESSSESRLSPTHPPKDM